MGSGASKSNGSKGDVVTQIHRENSEEFSPPPTLSRKKHPALQSANQLPKLPQNFDVSIKDVPRKIIGLEESDDEDTYGGKKGKGRNARDDKKLEHKLKREIVDLENTLSDLEASDGMVRNGRNVNRPYGMLARQASIDVRDNDYTYFERSQTSASRKLPTSSHRRMSYGNGAKGLRQYPRQYNMPNKHVSSIKFSWQEDSTAPNKDNEEEWTYKQTVIDGFDPDKFRKVNSKANSTDQTYHVERHIKSPPSATLQTSMFQASDMPGVPTYDKSERQLLATLEQELSAL